ncbi:tripartite motif-containing protein 40 isoform X2 [Trichosurus vulpecula]|uniref:tripartite motif-containing protein 40 isoform X2 n=1 Tax=Trichosurus vulpecula TaxID=9337 RepID=UPI00186B4FE1|nr:tripartite motif-containing protein 40 isoform X2 [Trichosurus vulpecula]
MDPQLASSPEKGLCPICQEHLREPVTTDCGHFFCQACLIQQAKKASDGDILNCSVCRKPWSPSILGAGYSCEDHQKLVGWFCEEKQLFLCSYCRTSPEHRTHHDLPVDTAIIHYKERIHRKVRKLRKFLGEPWHLPEEKQKLHTLLKQIDSEKDRLKAILEKEQTEGQLGSPLQQWLDRLNSVSAEVKELHDKISEAETHLNDLITELEEASKALNITLLKSVRDLLSRCIISVRISTGHCFLLVSCGCCSVSLCWSLGCCWLLPGTTPLGMNELVELLCS